MARIKKGDKVKIFQSGFWYTTGEVIEVEGGMVTTRYRDVDKYGVTTWRTIIGPEKYVELAPMR